MFEDAEMFEDVEMFEDARCHSSFFPGLPFHDFLLREFEAAVMTLMMTRASRRDEKGSLQRVAEKWVACMLYSLVSLGYFPGS